MATQLLLLEDVENLGRKGDLVNTKEGYAFNFLIPQGFAEVASTATIRKQAKLQEERKKIAAHDLKEAEEMAARLNGETLTFEVKIDHEGHMYGSVSQLDIVNLIQLQTGIELDKRFVQIKHAIKETGAFEIPLRLKEGIMTQINVVVTPEQPVA
jgi:large subunit ribosomal protein L9